MADKTHDDGRQQGSTGNGAHRHRDDSDSPATVADGITPSPRRARQRHHDGHRLVTMSASGEDRKSCADRQNDSNDPTAT